MWKEGQLPQIRYAAIRYAITVTNIKEHVLCRMSKMKQS